MSEPTDIIDARDQTTKDADIIDVGAAAAAAAMPTGGQRPSIGRIVTYRSITGDYDLAALITRTTASTSKAAAERGHLAPLADHEVDLTAFSPGPACLVQEHSVPFDPAGAPRTWRWPERV